jgi:hypothetical protein
MGGTTSVLPKVLPKAGMMTAKAAARIAASAAANPAGYTATSGFAVRAAAAALRNFGPVLSVSTFPFPCIFSAISVIAGAYSIYGAFSYLFARR